jgi:SAM-dependent methyltransferase
MTIPPKPGCWAPENARAFNLEAVARVYHLRPPYAEGLYPTLAGLITDSPRAVLDLGSGPGDLARKLVHVADRVDALDASLAMVERGREMEDGDHPNLRWIHGRAEDAPLQPPYALVTAADSLNWMDWEVIVPRIKQLLTPNGYLAIAGRVWGTETPEERELLSRFSPNKAFRPLNLVQELEARGLYRKDGAWGFSDAWNPTIEDYVGARRTQASYPTDPARAEAFDEGTRELLLRLVREGRLPASGDRLALTVTGGVAWGKPLTPSA